MRSRVPVLAAFGLAGAFALPTGASAQLPAATFDQAAAEFRFPVWKPSRMLGLKPWTFAIADCGFGGTSEYLGAATGEGSGRCP